MISYNLRQIKNNKSTANNKWYAYPVIDETMDLEGLANHMASHHSPFSKGVIKGILTDMVACIKEIMLEGKNVKIDDLAIFSIGIKNSSLVDAPEEFMVTKNVKGVKLRARATGILIGKNLDIDAQLTRARKGDASTEGGNTSAGGDNNGNGTTPETQP